MHSNGPHPHARRVMDCSRRRGRDGAAQPPQRCRARTASSPAPPTSSLSSMGPRGNPRGWGGCGLGWGGAGRGGVGRGGAGWGGAGRVWVGAGWVGAGRVWVGAGGWGGAGAACVLNRCGPGERPSFLTKGCRRTTAASTTSTRSFGWRATSRVSTSTRSRTTLGTSSSLCGTRESLRTWWGHESGETDRDGTLCPLVPPPPFFSPLSVHLYV